MKRRRDRGSAKSYLFREGVRHVTPDEDARATSDGAAESDEATESDVAATGGVTKSDAEANRRSVRSFLIAAVQAAVFVPALFYLQFGVIDSFALSFTGFLVVLCLLVALGFSIPNNPQSQTPVAATKGGLSGRVGSFWLMACAFGPFFGWLVTAPAFPLTEANWWWRYFVRAALSMGLPILTALPLFVYVRGKYWHVALLLLFGVTSLAVWSGANTLLDLREGPTLRRTVGYYDAPNNSFYPKADGRPFKLTTLEHTSRTIKIEPAPPDEKDSNP
jgi:hypothetical protein